MGEPTTWTGKFRTRYAVLFLLWIYATAWNLTKPFHMDDTVHLEIAQWIAGHPAHPMSGYIDGGDSMAPIGELNQPHLFFYLMAAVGQVFGWHEISMHALEAVFAFGAIALAYEIARHVRPNCSVYMTALAVVSPAFVVGQNVMVDVPLLAAVTGCYWALLAYRGPDAKRYLIAALMASAAILIKYNGLTLIPALYLDMILRGRGKYWKIGLVPMAAVSLWSAFNAWDYGHIHMLARHPTPGAWSGTIVERTTGLLLCVGASLPMLALAFLPASSNGGRRSWIRRGPGILGLLPLGLLAVAVLFVSTSALDAAMYRIVKTLLGISAVGVVFAAIRGGWAGWINDRKSDDRRADFWLLVYWALSFLVFAVLFAPFMATRHALPSIIPIVLLAGMGSAARLGRRRIALVAAVAWTAVVAAGDWWAAAAYRDAAFRVRESLPPETRVWALGHWGWKWYAQIAGMQGIARIASARAGDYVVWPTLTGVVTVPPTLALAKVGQMVIERDCCAGYLSATDAGWYTSGYWRLPWLPTRQPLDVVEIYRVTGNR
jgi:hypothetical protein